MRAIPNGWRPLLSPDGTGVAVGNGLARVIDLASGAETDLGGVDGGGLGARYPCGWHHGQPCLSEQTLTGRTLVNGPIAVPELQAPGYRPTVAVKLGRIASSLNGQHFINGVRQDHMDGHTCWDLDDFDGEHYLYKETDAVPWPTVVRHISGAFVRSLPDPISNARVFTAPNGQPWVLANLNGAAILYAPDGQTFTLPGESRGLLTWRGDELSVWTVLIDRDGAPVLLGRRFPKLAGSDPAKQLRGLWFAGLDHVQTPAGDLFAGYFDGPGGTTQVETVPFDAPMAPFVRAEETLEPIPSVLAPMLDGYLTDDPAAPGMFGGSKTGKPFLIEGCKQDGSAWWTPDEEPRLRLLFGDPQESHAPDVEERTLLEAQTRTGAWLGWYCDRPRFTEDVLATARATKAAGRPTLLMLRAYPTGPQDTADAIAARLTADIDLYRDEFTLAVIAPAYDQSGFWSTADRLLVRKALRALCGVTQARPGALAGIYFFGWKRTPVVRAIVEDAQAIIDATPPVDVDAVLPRRAPTPPVTPVPPVGTPPAVPTPPTRPPLNSPRLVTAAEIERRRKEREGMGKP